MRKLIGVAAVVFGLTVMVEASAEPVINPAIIAAAKPAVTGIRRFGVAVGTAAPVAENETTWEVEVFNPTKQAVSAQIVMRAIINNEDFIRTPTTIAAGERKWVKVVEAHPLRHGYCTTSIDYGAALFDAAGNRSDAFGNGVDGKATIACTFSALSAIPPRAGVPQQGRITVDTASATGNPTFCGAPIHWKAHLTNNTGQLFPILQLSVATGQGFGPTFALAPGQQRDVEGDTKFYGNTLMSVAMANGGMLPIQESPLGSPGVSTIASCTMSFGGSGLTAQQAPHPQAVAH
jgi:hypothetical protein